MGRVMQELPLALLRHDDLHHFPFPSLVGMRIVLNTTLDNRVRDEIPNPSFPFPMNICHPLTKRRNWKISKRKKKTSEEPNRKMGSGYCVGAYFRAIHNNAAKRVTSKSIFSCAGFYFVRTGFRSEKSVKSLKT
jgi:hypothetical protein